MTQMTQLTSVDIDKLIQRFDQENVVQALILLGSYARNEAGPNSDIDLVRFVISGIKLSDDGTHLDDKKRLINISTVEPDEYEKWFIEPFQATKWIAGLRVPRALIDRQDFFTHGLQIRARNFIWNTDIQLCANIEASRRMVGWSEEANKGLEGLRRKHDFGRLLNAIHGLSWGLSEVLQIHRGVLISSDNNAFHEVELALDDEHMIELRRITFGINENFNLTQRVQAGLELYVLIGEKYSNIWQENDIEIIQHTIKQIRLVLEK